MHITIQKKIVIKFYQKNRNYEQFHCDDVTIWLIIVYILKCCFTSLIWKIIYSYGDISLYPTQSILILRLKCWAGQPNAKNFHGSTKFDIKTVNEVAVHYDNIYRQISHKKRIKNLK